MKLDTYLRSNKIKGKIFAREIEVSEGHLSAMRYDVKWPSREILERINKVTGGQVTPNDFIDMGNGLASVDHESHPPTPK